jgi:hypothetical protein
MNWSIYEPLIITSTIVLKFTSALLVVPILTELGTSAMKRIVSIGPNHLRAICDEIGERLRALLDRSAPPASEYLMSLVVQLDHPAHLSLSIAPSFDHELEDFQPNQCLAHPSGLPSEQVSA